MIIYVSLLLAIIGFMVYVLKSPTKEDKENRISECFRILYMVGLFVFLWFVVGGKAASLLGR